MVNVLFVAILSVVIWPQKYQKKPESGRSEQESTDIITLL
jgi:hypothetical protein